jgi:hypothetical protein
MKHIHVIQPHDLIQNLYYDIGVSHICDADRFRRLLKIIKIQYECILLIYNQTTNGTIK